MPRPRTELPEQPVGFLDLLLPEALDLLRRHGAPEDWGGPVAAVMLLNYSDPATMREIAKAARGEPAFGARPTRQQQRDAARALGGFFDLYAAAPDAFLTVLAGMRELVQKRCGSVEFELAALLAYEPDLREKHLQKELADILSRRLERNVTTKAVERATQVLRQLVYRESPMIPPKSGD